MTPSLTRRPAAVTAALVVGLAIPLVTALVRVRTPTWFPSSDFAQAEMHVRSVPAHLPLVGAAGRLGSIFEQGSHPGPAGAIALSIPYRAAGSSSWSLMVATAALHLTAITGALVACRRTADTRAMIALAAIVAVMMHSFGTSWFLEPWNPWFGLFALLATAMCAWGAWSGDDTLLIGFAVGASFCAQVHVGYLPVVGGLAIALVIRLVARARHGDRARRRTVAAAVALGLVLWVPPALDQLTREPGNLSILWRHFSDPPDPPAGLRATLSAVVNEVNLVGSWSAGPTTHPSDSPTTVRWLGFVGLVLLVGLAVGLARRRRDRRALSA